MFRSKDLSNFSPFLFFFPSLSLYFFLRCHGGIEVSIPRSEVN